MTELLEFIKLYGAAGGLVLFFIWRDYKRECRLSARLDATEDFQKNHLAHLAADATAALNANTDASKHLCAALERRPCLSDEIRRMREKQ